MPTIQDLYDQVDEAEGLVEDLRGAVNFVLSHLPWYVPDWVADKVLDKWNELSDKAVAEIGDFRADIAAVGTPWTLRTAADQWATVVKSGITPLPGKIESGRLQSDEVFQGEAADAYRNMLSGQKDAVTGAAAQPEPISSGLTTLADAIDTWTTSMFVAFLALIGGIASAIAAVATSETGVGAIVGLAAAIVCFATLAGAIFVGETALNNGVEDVENVWNNAYNDWAGMDGTSWPQATFPS